MLSFIQMFGILLITITALSFIVKLFKQPIITGYLLSGLVFALFFASRPGVHEQMTMFSELGITFLLFFMGLQFDLKSLKYMGTDIVIAASVQSIIFFAMGFGTALLFGFTLMECSYIAILFMFSSTLLVAKWVADKKETNVLHGKIILAILIIQDIFAILTLTVLGVLRENSVIKIFLIPFEGIILVGVAIILAKYLLNYPLKVASRYPELLFILSLSVCFIFVEISPLLGYSTTIGAFIGGIVLANTMYKIDLVSRLKPLIIFFNMLFFVGLGFQMQLDLSYRLVFLILVLSAMSLLLKPIVFFLTLRARGYDAKTSLTSGIYLAQLSEFGVIIIAAGVSSGSVPGWVSSVSIIAIILTMVVSSYFIKYDKKTARFFEKLVLKLDRKFVIKEVKTEHIDMDCSILFFGYYDIGRDLMAKFKAQGKKIVVIENDPENIALIRKEGLPCIYSSVNDPDFFEQIDFSKVELAVSSHTDLDDNKLIIKEIKKRNPKARVIVSAKNVKESLELYKSDADYVVYSVYLNEQRVSVLLEDYSTDINKLLEKKISEMAKLQEKENKYLASRERGFLDIDKFVKKAAQDSDKRLRKTKGFFGFMKKD